MANPALAPEPALSPEPILFFTSKNLKYGYLSNFFNIEMYEGGLEFSCTEQYFMYYKCVTFDPTNNLLLEKILNEKTPYKIKQYGRQVKNYNDKVWNEKRYSIMLNALRLKFTQNDVIKAKLISTKPKTLYEASPYDSIWGIGLSVQEAMYTDPSQYGINLLGQALMQVRDEFKI